jgi:hypothetical protein
VDNEPVIVAQQALAGVESHQRVEQSGFTDVRRSLAWFDHVIVRGLRNSAFLGRGDCRRTGTCGPPDADAGVRPCKGVAHDAR